ncbi:HemK family protein methyltransferase [bacterium]|nr:HemK family protein methyltransferase [bacterium]
MVEIPKEYKDGFKYFLGTKIDLSKKPLIPRIETEFWVKQAIEEISKKQSHCLDLFSGSGCVGVAVLKNTDSYCDFGELNEDFLEQIEINTNLSAINSLRYSILKTNIFSGISKKYDYILANPPYIAESRIKDVGLDVLAFEPKMALFSGVDGMSVIRIFLNDAKKYLNKKGVIYMEFDPQQKFEIDGLLKNNKYSNWDFSCDQFGLIRFVRIVL